MDLFTAEYPSSWNDPKVKKWEAMARNLQQMMYLQFAGAQFHDITALSEEARITKVCYAINGPPTQGAKNLESAYSTEQRNFGKICFDKIKEVWRQSPESRRDRKRIKLGFVFVYCKEGEKEYQVPLFRLLWDANTGSSRFIDTSLRVYTDAEDWKANNRMPMMKYCFPANLYYTCDKSSGAYNFDPKQEVAVGFDTSPACNFLSRVFSITDQVNTAVGVSVAITALISASILNGPVLLSICVVTASWGVGRAIYRLADKKLRGENMDDLESKLLILSIISSPLNFLNAFVGAKLAAGAAGGRIFTHFQRELATLLIWTTIGVDSFSLVFSMVYLIEKADNKQLTTLDCLLFSMSALFFGNMVIQPKTAEAIIMKAQQQKIGEVARQMTDAEAKAAFKKYLEHNKSKGNIQEGSNVVKDLIKMEDPNAFFKSVKNFPEVEIGAAYAETVRSETAKVQKPGKLKACLGGKDYRDHQYLGELNEQQIGRLNPVFGGTAKYDENIVNFSSRVARELKMKNNPDGYMSIVEMVVAKTKQDNNFVRTGNARDFAAGIQRDLAKVQRIGSQKELKFADPYKALYHYRKHGEQFMKKCTPEFYLGELPGQIKSRGKLADACRITSNLKNGGTEVYIRKTYFRDDDAMLVVIEKEHMKTVSTMFHKPKCWEEYTQRFQEVNTSTLKANFAKLAVATGFDAVQLQNRCSTLFFQRNNLTQSDPNYAKYQKMVGILVQDLANCLIHDSQ
ncbi:hypothetical protein CRE_06059 [Caenorhabditis remanei]|uniref:Uncharacterized protein n=1 Tax=Caenorhabditis remanei TaxID=31234 RepID=E3NAY5_CAERE|nr:hypothetical protein CRE_06059 [Caenorhabditis remanei]